MKRTGECSDEALTDSWHGLGETSNMNPRSRVQIPLQCMEEIKSSRLTVLESTNGCDFAIMSSKLFIMKNVLGLYLVPNLKL